jgi:predicted secreted protein
MCGANMRNSKSILLDIETDQFQISWSEPNNHDAVMVKTRQTDEYDSKNEFYTGIDSMAEFILNAVKSGTDVLNSDYIESLNIVMQVKIGSLNQ